MKYSTYHYYADYKIIEFCNTKYIYCSKSIQEFDEEYRFDTERDTRNLIKAILNLNLENEEEILKFTSEYGLLVNTQNDPEHPTYCGKPIPKKFNNFISPAEVGFSIPLHIFKYLMELIRNILHLSTEIALYNNYMKKANSSSSAHEDYTNNILNIIKFFLSLMYQPYATHSTITEGINLVFDGDTPLSRFAYNYHEALLGFLLLKPVNPISHYNYSLLELSQKNTALSIKFNSMDYNKNITSEANIPRLKLEDCLNISYSMSKKDYETFILSDDFFENSPKERQESIIKARYAEKSSDNSDTNHISFSITQSIAPDYKYKNTLNSPASDTLYYNSILKILLYLNNYFDLDYRNPHKIEVALKNNVKPDSTQTIMESINKLSRQIITETINSFTQNINYRLDADEKGLYAVTLVSESLIQSIFLKMADILNKYNITICKYRKCNNPVFSLKSRPAQCCCHTHLTSYLRYKERHS